MMILPLDIITLNDYAVRMDQPTADERPSLKNRLVCRPDNELYERVRIEAIRQRSTVENLLIQALRDYLSTKEIAK